MAGMLEGKVALVTGGASGIGRAAVLAFLREGARVVFADLDEAEAAKTLTAVQEKGGEARFLPSDVTDESQVEALVQHALASFGGLDCAFNNAGITGTAGPVESISLEGWEHTLRTNLTSVFLCMKHEIPVMRERGGGAIVNTASGAGVIAVPHLSPYCASKHAVLGLSKSAAVENARAGIRVNAICPGSIDTPMLQASLSVDPRLRDMILKNQPSGRLGLPEEVAEAALWLCSDRASLVSGEAMLVDGATVAR